MEISEIMEIRVSCILIIIVTSQALGLLINLMEHSKQNIASLVVVKTRLSYEDSQSCKDSKESEKIERGKDVPAVEALVNLFQLRAQAARDSEAMNCELTSTFCTLIH
jgi:hypothetical protein